MVQVPQLRRAVPTHRTVEQPADLQRGVRHRLHRLPDGRRLVTTPRPGDRVKVEYEGEYASFDSVKPNGYASGTPIPKDAKVTVIKRRSDLVPGQVWKRKNDGDLFQVYTDYVGDLMVASANNENVSLEGGNF